MDLEAIRSSGPLPASALRAHPRGSRRRRVRHREIGVPYDIEIAEPGSDRAQAGHGKAVGAELAMFPPAS